MAEIIIYRAPIHSGKTSRLKEWVKKYKDVFGFLTPDDDDLRIILNLATKEKYLWQVRSISQEAVIEVGKFLFLESGFDQAQQILASFYKQKEGYFVIDEIGKLELKNQGLEPELMQCIDSFRMRNDASTLILIVRDYLLDEVIEKYKLEKAIVVGHDYFENS